MVSWSIFTNANVSKEPSNALTTIRALQAAGKVQLQRLALHFSAAASLQWDLAAFSAANREARTSADPAMVSLSPSLPATSPTLLPVCPLGARTLMIP